MAKKKRSTSKRNTKRPTNKNGLWGINLTSFDGTLNSLEHQAEKAYKEVKRHWDKGDIFQLAHKKKADVYSQVKHLADGILDTLKKADFLAQKETLVKKAKKNLGQLVTQVQRSAILDKTKDLATHKTHELLSHFNIPTKNDVKSLNQRLSKLEKRLSQIAGH